MAPIDRAEHRQQRMRGAGVANVQASFAFNLGGLNLARPPGRPARTPGRRQSSLPPIRSSRRSRTPVSVVTPGSRASASKSTKRHRSASAPRSVIRSQSRSKSKTPVRNVRTPQQLGRRRLAKGDADEVDELSPEHALSHGSERKRRSVSKSLISPIREGREEKEDTPDELSFVGEAVEIEVRQTPGSTAVEASQAEQSVVAETPVRTSINANTKRKRVSDQRVQEPSAGPAAALTPAEPPPRSARKKSTNTPRPDEAAEEGEDELSSPKVDAAPARRSKTKSPLAIVQGESEVDELSPVQGRQTSGLATPRLRQSAKSPLAAVAAAQEKALSPLLPRPRGRPRSVARNTGNVARSVEATQKRARDEMQDKLVPVASAAAGYATPALAATTSKKRKPSHVIEEDDEDVIQTTPASDKPRRSRSKSATAEREVLHSTEREERQQEVDELSFQDEQPDRPASRPLVMHKRKQLAPSVEIYEDVEEPEDEQDETFEEPGPISDIEDAEEEHRHLPPIEKSKPRAATDVNASEPPAKRQKKSHRPRGPTLPIHTYRLTSLPTSSLKSHAPVTVVDTTRTLVEEWTTHRINRLTYKLTAATRGSSANDPTFKEVSRALRRKRHLFLEYREKLDDVLLELQDANNTLASHATKLKRYKARSRALRNDYIAIQREIDEALVAHDHALEEFEAERREKEGREGLSGMLWEIQRAVERGRQRAAVEDREAEGPVKSLAWAVETVGSRWGESGLFGSVRRLNGVLESAAGVLEGRA